MVVFPSDQAGLDQSIKARKTAMLICAICVVPVVLAAFVTNMWVAVILIAIAGLGTSEDGRAISLPWLLICFRVAQWAR